MSISTFDDHECICEHPPSAHDDGFGCTSRSCPCIAGWSVTAEIDPDDLDWRDAFTRED